MRSRERQEAAHAAPEGHVKEPGFILSDQKLLGCL